MEYKHGQNKKPRGKRCNWTISYSNGRLPKALNLVCTPYACLCPFTTSTHKFTHLLQSASHPLIQQGERQVQEIYRRIQSWQMAVLNTIITTYFPPLCLSAVSSATWADSIQPTMRIKPPNNSQRNVVQFISQKLVVVGVSVSTQAAAHIVSRAINQRH